MNLLSSFPTGILNSHFALTGLGRRREKRREVERGEKWIEEKRGEVERGEEKWRKRKCRKEESR
jgi:hypothetical protein